MTVNVANLDITTDTFGTWVAKTNTLAQITTNHAVTIDGTAFGNNSTGNGTVIGRFGANTLFAINGLRGGDVAVSNTLVISSNLSVANTSTFTGAVTFSNTIVVAGQGTFTTNVGANVVTGNNLSVGNVSVNTTTLTITGLGGTISAFANSSTARITLGNSVVNATHLSSNNGYFTGNLVVDGTFITTSDLSVAGDLLPPVTNTYDVGNTTNTFRNAFFHLVDSTNADVSNSITIGTTVVNSSVLQSAGLFTVNTTSNTVGSARFSNSVVVVGNTTLSNTLSVTGNVTFSNTVNVTGLTTVSSINSTTANTTNLNVSGPASLTSTLNVTGLTTVGSINATTANATAINVGANVNLTTTSITIGNSSVNAFANSTTLDIDGTLLVAGLATISNTINTSGPINVGSNVVLTTTQIRVGNSTANVTISNNSINVNGSTINSTSFSGTAQNASTLEGVSLSTIQTQITSNASAAFTNAISSAATLYQTMAGLAANVAMLTSNNAQFLGGVAASAYPTTTGNFTISGLRTHTANIAMGTSTITFTGGSVNSTAVSVGGDITATAGSLRSQISGAATTGQVVLGNGSFRLFQSGGNFDLNGTLSSGAISTSGTVTTTAAEVTVGTGQNEQKRLRFQNANRNVFFYLDGTTLALWDATASTNRWVTDASGNFTATGNITAFSDAKLKENVETINNALDTVAKLRGVKYTRKDTGEAGIGVIAQEVQKYIPEVVHENENLPLSVSYGNMIGLLIEAIKDLKAKVEELENKVK